METVPLMEEQVPDSTISHTFRMVCLQSLLQNDTGSHQSKFIELEEVLNGQIWQIHASSKGNLFFFFFFFVAQYLSSIVSLYNLSILLWTEEIMTSWVWLLMSNLMLLFSLCGISQNQLGGVKRKGPYCPESLSYQKKFPKTNFQKKKIKSSLSYQM